MEIRRLAVCLAFFVLAASQCSEARHSLHRRDADYEFDDTSGAMNDEATDDDDTQNDGDTADEPKPAKEPSVMVTKPHNYEARLGEDVRLECQVSPDNDTVVSWFQNNVLLFMGTMKLNYEADRYSLVPNSKDLLIKNVQPSDAGIFRCDIAQKVPASVNHTLYFPEKPQVISMTATNGGNVVEASDVSIACTVTGVPAPQVVWSLARNDENQRLTEKDGDFTVNGNVYSLHIRSIRPEQSGRYMCYAFNKEGSHIKDITVEVNAKPKVHVHKTVVNSDIQVEAVLQCSTHEKPIPHIRWYKDGALIEDSSSQFTVSTHGSHSNLTVLPSADKDFGTFTCEAENTFGKHNRSIELVQRPVIEALEADGPKLAWTVHSHQPLEEMEVQLRDATGNGEWMRLSVPLPQGKDHKYDVTFSVEDKQLEAGKYEAVVKVKNSKSWAGSHDAAIVEIVEDVQPQYIQHASVFRENNGAYSVQPASTVISTILMYLLVRML